jgi:hypothetical protein
MKDTMAIVIASIALVLSVVAIATKPFGNGNINKYSFATPIDAYRSNLQMIVNKDFLAQIRYHFIIQSKGIEEKLNTLKVAKEREYGGKKLLFIEFTENGVPKKEVVTLEKDVSSGFWNNEYLSGYEVEKTEPYLAAEMKSWE